LGRRKNVVKVGLIIDHCRSKDDGGGGGAGGGR